MPTPRIPIDASDQVFFITPTVRRWYYLFDRHHRWNILADAIVYAQENKGLKLHGYVFMLNHIHLIFQAPDPIAFLRDFKRHTAKKILENIRQTEPNVEQLFLTDKNEYELWMRSNMPEFVESGSFFIQKLNYIHNNPVRKRYVREAKDWLWSSAAAYETGDMNPLPVDILET